MVLTIRPLAGREVLECGHGYVAEAAGELEKPVLVRKVRGFLRPGTRLQALDAPQRLQAPEPPGHPPEGGGRCLALGAVRPLLLGVALAHLFRLRRVAGLAAPEAVEDMAVDRRAQNRNDEADERQAQRHGDQAAGEPDAPAMGASERRHLVRGQAPSGDEGEELASDEQTVHGPEHQRREGAGDHVEDQRAEIDREHQHRESEGADHGLDPAGGLQGGQIRIVSSLHGVDDLVEHQVHHRARDREHQQGRDHDDEGQVHEPDLAQGHRDLADRRHDDLADQGNVGASDQRQCQGVGQNRNQPSGADAEDDDQRGRTGDRPDQNEPKARVAKLKQRAKDSDDLGHDLRTSRLAVWATRRARPPPRAAPPLRRTRRWQNPTDTRGRTRTKPCNP